MYQSSEQLADNRLLWNPQQIQVESLFEQGSGTTNEDFLLQKGETFGVFDGATSLSNDRFENGLTGGLLAAQLAAKAFQSGQDLLHCMEKANGAIREEMLLRNISGQERHRLWSTSAAVVRIRQDRLHYCQTGDCLILLIHKDGSHKLITPATNHDRETLTLWKNSGAPEGAKIHETMADQIIKVRLEMNSTYGVLNGEPEAMDFICHGQAPLENISDILLFSDGLFLPSPSPWQETNWHTFTALYKEGGLRRIRDHIRTLEKKDPYCRDFPRFKQHDDISALAIHF